MLTPEQKKQIDTLINPGLWNSIYDYILTDEQRGDPEAMKAIAFEMEEILEKAAALFGLCGIGE